MTSSKSANLQNMSSWLLGIWLGLTFCKLGNPIIFEGQTPPPSGLLEAIFSSWPMSWGYVILGVAILAGLPFVNWKRRPPNWALCFLLFWFGWQVFSTAQTTSGRLSGLTVPHFGACVVSFFIGAMVISRLPRLSPVWICLLVGFAFVCWMGLDQHFGGLERTRKEFLQMDWNQFSPDFRAKLDTPEFRKKIMSERIFATFVYANALAGGILLLMPICLWGMWELFKWLSFASRIFLLGTFSFLGLGCLYWSGSKAGWLIALGMAAAAFYMSSVNRTVKWIFLVVLVLAGVAGFYAKYQGYFAKGATSAAARTDYWKAAWQTALERPILGSGPGTFSIEYQRKKSPESEMARLTHNDYLEQASDSGWPGFISYTSFILASLVALYRNGLPTWRDKALWLGTLGLAAQSVVEFGLYIPALAWPFFLFLGWLWGNHGNRVDIPKQAA